MTAGEALQKTRTILYSATGCEVGRTVAESLARELAVNAEIRETNRLPRGKPEGTITVALAGDGLSRQTAVARRSLSSEKWASFRIGPEGDGELVASHPHLLYALFCLIKDEWVDEDVSTFSEGKILKPAFLWLRNLSDFFVRYLRRARHFDREDFVKQLARQGFSHVTINGLGADRPYESGPPGDVYSWFYDYDPDLDQFVDSMLLKGYYPPEYLQSNLRFLKENASLAAKYGLTPGLHINSPRSMPEQFWDRYGFLRGARIDHPRESFRPRYTLAMAHPAVQEHYRELIRKIMAEVPEIGFIHLWTNDSGSGFEFVSSLYAGRNGGPYLIREWKSDDEIARKAAENVLTYYHLLTDEAKKFNPNFRLLADLGPFYAERKYIVRGLGKGIDVGAFGSFEVTEDAEEKKLLRQSGVIDHTRLELTNNNVPGAPFPRLVYKQLKKAAQQKGRRVLVHDISPHSLAPFDINGEVVRRFQLQPEVPLDSVLRETAERWVGSEYAERLLRIWDLSDLAVSSCPTGMPYSTFAFPWFRLWVRPFVPNIDAIPESEREYYEKFLISTFNNPARVDLNNDMMWNFLTVKQAKEKKETVDRKVITSLAKASRLTTETLGNLPPSKVPWKVFDDLRVRIAALLCFYTTLRNVTAWIESVHGYLQAKTNQQRKKYRELARQMVESELQNTRALLALWEGALVDFVPISSACETLHIYGENFGELLKKKMRLMEKHINDEPYIDPNYMWRMPNR
jgi:hypothetical protein